ncbi:LuxR C-terminal-related transcriptional regulator [Methylocella sp.]|jgi:DNA-binding CsgD family transcriptional regulator|uniref:helix-turn-helix transcriptional regulator n=1 Tax=Methylocella sp. TaxID=1978226 RepID=UPI003C1B4120
MLGLDDVDIGTLLQLEADLTDQSLDAFLAFIRRHYALSEVAYYCPSFRGRSLAEPFIALSSGEVSLDNSRALYEALFEPAFSAGAHSLLPVDWARLPVREPKGARPGDRRRQGLTVPVRGPTNGVWALFGVRSDESDREWSDRRHELMKDLVHVAHYVHQRAYDLHAKDAPIDLNAITRREIEALEWSAEGKSPAEIAITMRISLETVKAHLDSARFKLQALNRVHTVTKAIRAGLIR